MRPDGLYAGDEPAEPNAPVGASGTSEAIAPPAQVIGWSSQPDLVDHAVVPLPSAEPPTVAPVNVPAQTPYGSYQAYVGSPISDALPPWAEEILSEAPFRAPADDGEPEIWHRYQELVESQVDAAMQASVLRAGWLALHGRVGEEA